MSKKHNTTETAADAEASPGALVAGDAGEKQDEAGAGEQRAADPSPEVTGTALDAAQKSGGNQKAPKAETEVKQGHSGPQRVEKGTPDPDAEENSGKPFSQRLAEQRDAD